MRRVIPVLILCIGLLVSACDDRASSRSRSSAANAEAPKPPEIAPLYKDKSVPRKTYDPEDIMNAQNAPEPKGEESKYNFKEATPPDLAAAAKSPQFQAAIQHAAKLCGSAPLPLKNEEDEPTGGVVFDVPHAKAEELLGTPRRQMFPMGAYLFRYDNNFGLGDQPDRLGLLPTTDKYVVLAAVQSNGANFNIGPGDIIDWLKDMEKIQPWELTDAGLDVVAGNFLTPVKDPDKLAKKMYEFCPDIVDQGTGDVEKLAAELKKGKLYFWWD